ncbi:50S ribosomal protein L4 [Dubosiella muris]|uniref:50S ribosomal protein L4 n=1 Tax=Dubosiella muris TaxID=3038133 RepID=A0AC61R4K2_9FIRM|nr:50S ribosomal protein L4 [Dubosiella muris]TGY64897.1 50S ribosomal protein L4 [Dubosiella muris]
MATLDVINQAGAVVGTIELNDEVFGIEPNQQALYDALIMQQASRRQGTASTRGRSEVRGGGRKPYRQKGTGRARQGSIRAPQYRGGGTVFGPKPRNYAYKINKKVRRLALKSALSEKLIGEAMNVMDKLELAAPKTKDFVAIVDAIQAPYKTLFVVAEADDNTNAYLSARNLPGVSMMSSKAINVYDLVNANKVVMTSAAVKEIEEALA